jgi:hypothetical protein
MQARLHRTAADLQSMLDQLTSQRRAARYWKLERALKTGLRAAIRWVDWTLAAPQPTEAEEAARFVMSLYRLDEAVPRLVDNFHRLMEATGETYFPV